MKVMHPVRFDARLDVLDGRQRVHRLFLINTNKSELSRGIAISEISYRVELFYTYPGWYQSEARRHLPVEGKNNQWIDTILLSNKRSGFHVNTRPKTLIVEVLLLNA